MLNNIVLPRSSGIGHFFSNPEGVGRIWERNVKPCFAIRRSYMIFILLSRIRRAYETASPPAFPGRKLPGPPSCYHALENAAAPDMGVMLSHFMIAACRAFPLPSTKLLSLSIHRSCLLALRRLDRCLHRSSLLSRL